MFPIGLHIYLVRKHGVAPQPAEDGPPKKFFSEQVFKDTVAIFSYFVILVVLAVAVRVPLGQLADPTDTTFVPRPEWYFLFLFESLKFFDGPLEVIGTVFLPTLAILTLFLIPFIDRGRAIRAARRTTAIGATMLVGLGWGALTMAAFRATPAANDDVGSIQPQAAPGTGKSARPQRSGGNNYPPRN